MYLSYIYPRLARASLALGNVSLSSLAVQAVELMWQPRSYEIIRDRQPRYDTLFSRF